MTLFRDAARIAGKELRAGFRDRQTVLYTFVLPVCLYPVLFWVMLQAFLVIRGQADATDVRVGLVAPAQEVEDARRVLELGPDGGERAAADAAAAALGLGGGGVVEVETRPGPIDEAAARAWLAEADCPDAVLAIPGDRTAEGSGALLYADGTESRANVARERVRERMRGWVERRREDAARRLDVAPDALEPLRHDAHDVAPEGDQGALALSLVLPLLLVVMAVMGAFFPAVDLTAGEKERGTAETTLLLPVPRAAVHLGKILVVCVSALVATSLNLAALALAAERLLAGIEEIRIDLPLLAFVQVAPLVLLFAFFVAATLTGLAGTAATFKEGQALLGPAQMVFILPAMASILPGLQLDWTTAWIPVVNVTLAFRELLVGEAALGPLLACGLSLLAYGALAIAFAVRLLSREGLALAGESIPFGRLLSLLRSPGGSR